MTTISRALRVTQSELIGYRRTWRGTVISSIVNPVLYLAAMGAGLGVLVDSSPADLGVTYLAFVATGMMAASGMQAGASEGSFPVMAGFKWRKNYFATIATPLGPDDIVYGKVVWAAIRFTFILSVFALIATGFGALDLGSALLAVLPGVLTGLAFMSCVMAWTVTRDNELSLSSLFRFGIVPLFLFSGTFFPISQLPGFLQPIAYATPLFHGVELVRKIALPDSGTEIVTSMPMWIHVTYLVVMLALGVYLSVRFLERRLRT
jgi:lipooligosaccharide transport system permease protein